MPVTLRARPAKAVDPPPDGGITAAAGLKAPARRAPKKVVDKPQAAAKPARTAKSKSTATRTAEAATTAAPKSTTTTSSSRTSKPATTTAAPKKVAGNKRSSADASIDADKENAVPAKKARVTRQPKSVLSLVNQRAGQQISNISPPDSARVPARGRRAATATQRSGTNTKAQTETTRVTKPSNARNIKAQTTEAEAVPISERLTKATKASAAKKAAPKASAAKPATQRGAKRNNNNTTVDDEVEDNSEPVDEQQVEDVSAHEQHDEHKSADKQDHEEHAKLIKPATTRARGRAAKDKAVTAVTRTLRPRRGANAEPAIPKVETVTKAEPSITEDEPIATAAPIPKTASRVKNTKAAQKPKATSTKRDRTPKGAQSSRAKKQKVHEEYFVGTTDAAHDEEDEEIAEVTDDPIASSKDTVTQSDKVTDVPANDTLTVDEPDTIQQDNVPESADFTSLIDTPVLPATQAEVNPDPMTPSMPKIVIKAVTGGMQACFKNPFNVSMISHPSTEVKAHVTQPALLRSVADESSSTATAAATPYESAARQLDRLAEENDSNSKAVSPMTANPFLRASQAFAAHVKAQSEAQAQASQAAQSAPAVKAHVTQSTGESPIKATVNPMALVKEAPAIITMQEDAHATSPSKLPVPSPIKDTPAPIRATPSLIRGTSARKIATPSSRKVTASGVNHFALAGLVSPKSRAAAAAAAAAESPSMSAETGMNPFARAALEFTKHQERNKAAATATSPVKSTAVVASPVKAAAVTSPNKTSGAETSPSKTGENTMNHFARAALEFQKHQERSKVAAITSPSKPTPVAASPVKTAAAQSPSKSDEEPFVLNNACKPTTFEAQWQSSAAATTRINYFSLAAQAHEAFIKEQQASKSPITEAKAAASTPVVARDATENMVNPFLATAQTPTAEEGEITVYSEGSPMDIDDPNFGAATPVNPFIAKLLDKSETIQQQQQDDVLGAPMLSVSPRRPPVSPTKDAEGEVNIGITASARRPVLQTTLQDSCVLDPPTSRAAANPSPKWYNPESLKVARRPPPGSPWKARVLGEPYSTGDHNQTPRTPLLSMAARRGPLGATPRLNSRVGSTSRSIGPRIQNERLRGSLFKVPNGSLFQSPAGNASITPSCYNTPLKNIAGDLPATSDGPQDGQKEQDSEVIETHPFWALPPSHALPPPVTSPLRSALKSPQRNAAGMTSVKKTVQWKINTPSPIPFKPAERTGPLKGNVFFIDAKNDAGEDLYDTFKPLLEKLGGTVQDNWFGTDDEFVNYVIFNNGSDETLKKVMASDGATRAVNLSWALDCERHNTKMQNSGYKIDLSRLYAKQYPFMPMTPRPSAGAESSTPTNTNTNKESAPTTSSSGGVGSFARSFLPSIPATVRRMIGASPLPAGTPKTPEQAITSAVNWTDLRTVGNNTPATPDYLKSEALAHVQKSCPARAANAAGKGGPFGYLPDSPSDYIEQRLERARRKSVPYERLEFLS